MARSSVGAVLALVLVLGAARGWAADEKPMDLLRLPGVRLEATGAGAEAAALAALTDGDAATAIDVAASAAAPFEVVFGFGGADVAPEGVRVTLPEKAGEAPPAARVEVMVSTTSAHAGFRSVRADPLAAGQKPALLEFLPLQARWILVRLWPAPGAKRLAVAGVEVLGRPGPPESRYAFAEAPAKAFDVLARLEKASALKVTVSADEKALFARAQAARLDAQGFADAALLASGVLDPARRAEYRRRLDALEQQARAALASVEGPAARGDALLRWLHRGPLSKGYVAGQTDLHTVLDTGTFNCVSSAALFNGLALRLGLDARAIEVPTHAFSIVYEGTLHRDVETTTPEGFDPARDPAVVARFEKATGFRYLPDIHRDQRREVEEAGLAAIIYYNHGVQLAEGKRYHEALLSFFRAMSLDAEFASAVKGALGVLAKWGVELAEAGQPEPALEVIGTGLALAPKDAALNNNRLWVWQRWAEREIDAGRADAALAVLERAAAAVPDGGFAQRQAWVFLKGAEKHADAGRWEEALAASEPGLGRLAGPPREELLQWRANLWLRWFGAEVHAKRFEAAASVLEKGLAAQPGHPGLLGNAGYLAQEWARATADAEGAAPALALLRSLRARFPGHEGVVEAGANHVRRVAYRTADAGRFAEALDALQAGGDLLPDDAARQQVGVYVFDHWAQERMNAGAWAEAADVYVRARERWPQERLLAQNIAYLAQEWNKAAYKEGGAEAVARVTRTLKEKFPDVAFAAQGGANELKRAVNDLVRAGKHAEAVKALEEGAALLEGDKEAKDLWVFVYDFRGRSALEAGRFEEAADAYAEGLARLPKDRDLANNLGYLAQQWAQQLAATDPTKAVEVLRGLVKRFPEVGDVAEAAQRHVLRTVQERSKAQPEAALADLEAWKDLVPKERDVEGAAVGVYDRWARGLAQAASWQEAVDVYAKALERLPKNGHLTNNAVATWFEWAKTFSDAKRWDEAIAVYDRGLERMPGTSLFQRNRAWCAEQKQKQEK